MSRRTRDALNTIGVSVPDHRSRQVAESDIESADLVIAMASEHVAWVRRRHPAAADRTATLRWLARYLPRGPESLRARVSGLGLEGLDPDVQGDVVDPAGGEESDYVQCARDIEQLVRELVERLG
jgi:protein-tyrosine-phosphatase